MQPKLAHEHAFFFLNLATINFVCTRSSRNKRGGALSWHSTQLTRQLCALIKQVFWKHSILIIQEDLQAFFLLEKGGIHKSAAKAKIFPALVVLSCVVLCYEEPVLCCHGLLSCLATVGTLAFISTMLFFRYVRCRERAKVAEYPAMYKHMNKVFGFWWLGRH